MRVVPSPGACLLPSCAAFGVAVSDPSRRFCSVCACPLGTATVGPDRAYRIEAVLGSGYYAHVFRAVDRRSGIVRAAKVYGPFPGKRQAAQREEAALRALRHARVPTLADAFDEDTNRFLILELIGGDNLRHTVETAGPLTVENALRLAMEVGEALAYVAATGWTYRDLHPKNIHLDPGRGAVLLDFDNARPPSSPAEMAGRAGYRAPELETPGPVTPACDVYGLAGCVFFALTGDDPPEVPGPLPLLDDSAAALPPAVRELLNAGRQADPSRRPTAEVLVAAARHRR